VELRRINSLIGRRLWRPGEPRSDFTFYCSRWSKGEETRWLGETYDEDGGRDRSMVRSRLCRHLGWEFFSYSFGRRQQGGFFLFFPLTAARRRILDPCMNSSLLAKYTVRTTKEYLDLTCSRIILQIPSSKNILDLACDGTWFTTKLFTDVHGWLIHVERGETKKGQILQAS
jgi:hypothetical protein